MSLLKSPQFRSPETNEPGSTSTTHSPALSEPGWFCLRSQPKHEHIAATHLKRKIEKIEVFCPRLRTRKQTRRGPVWFVEALFPGYLFARFNPAEQIQAIKTTPGINALVRFGDLIPRIPDGVIENLRADFDQDQIHEFTAELTPGQEVTIASGAFSGLKANVIRVLPGNSRVQLLMNLLGRMTPVEVQSHELMGEKPIPEGFCNSASTSASPS